jgi:hypothetical protein
MRHDLNIDLVFPIKDEVSAWLMCLKAESLYEAGIIDADEMSAVLERVAAVLDQLPKQAVQHLSSVRRSNSQASSPTLGGRPSNHRSSG